ncbi:MAG: hypothetical protein ACI4WS_11595 [Oscillospiraceae bacterium]
MVSVSDRFIELAQQNGRNVWCRIVADGVEFLDDSIIDMDFDDVVHPDWFTLGTTCANRLHFTARYSGELDPGAEVTAFISFDGEEWCPLGVFFIARRYVRGNYISVTAYDKLYSLDVDYRYDGVLPVTADALMQDVCGKVGLECADPGYPYTLEAVPEGCTARDIIGYIAGMNRACAKIDRSGKLTLKYPDRISFELQDKNCWEVQRNMSSSVVTSIKVNTGEGEIVSGSGAEISTLEMYNPFMTQALADKMLSMFKPFSFHGAELEMQGMPFLEAGDLMYFLDGKLLYQLMISEIEYRYNGGLSAVLYSKNRVNDEEAGDLERLLEQLVHTKDPIYYKQINERQTALTDEPQIIVDFEFESEEDCFAQLDVNFTVKESTADFLIARVNVNGVDIPRRSVQTLTGADYELIHLYHLAEKLPAGRNRVYVTAQTKSGEAYIPAGDMLATLVGHGIYGNHGSQRDKVSLYEKTDRWQLVVPKIFSLDVTGELNKEVT